MKTILTAALLLTTAFMMTPGASACTVSDPTGTTYTCVDQYEYSSGGDCSMGEDGYQYSSTYAYSYAPGVAQVSASMYDYCDINSQWGYEYDYSSESASVYVYPTGSYVGAGHYDYTYSWGGSTYEYCETYTYHNLDGNWNYDYYGCPI